tara:strand:- start:1681 stop:2262 length:582 start_codon:yes stop_codon:yes gene_type:complete
MGLQEQIIGFARAYPSVLLFTCFTGYFLTNNINILMLGIALLVDNSINAILKYGVFRPLFGDTKLLVLGSGKRPAGAKNCALFVEKNAKRAKSYGMPSGHSQASFFFLTYLIMHLKDSNMNMYEKIFGGSLFTFITLGIVYSRIYLKCHTIQQVSVGSLIGLGLGYLYYENQEKIKDFVKIEKTSKNTDLTKN